jgi:hypothetical protein
MKEYSPESPADKFDYLPSWSFFISYPETDKKQGDYPFWNPVVRILSFKKTKCLHTNQQTPVSFPFSFSSFMSRKPTFGCLILR